MSELEFKPGTIRRIDWIIDGYVYGEYDLFECGARIGRTLTANVKSIGGDE
ncbi:hypothetical protein SAMN04490240_4090 [Rhodococcus pyridinivorans]|uniref:hypothetical protein n=1 Tax=Rhodococcus pyridinivorans TaxID=103816 RepID=UPI00089C5155|nr:hypothetical protein [Rhodococcus pyridinivorans]SED51815.1 hypothetical protein SAMN04490240_4090 [Rhodococcus pyridinivorans]